MYHIYALDNKLSSIFFYFFHEWCLHTLSSVFHILWLTPSYLWGCCFASFCAVELFKNVWWALNFFSLLWNDPTQLKRYKSKCMMIEQTLIQGEFTGWWNCSEKIKCIMLPLRSIKHQAPVICNYFSSLLEEN